MTSFSQSPIWRMNALKAQAVFSFSILYILRAQEKQLSPLCLNSSLQEKLRYIQVYVSIFIYINTYKSMKANLTYGWKCFYTS